jgi:hypothetical protein
VPARARPPRTRDAAAGQILRLQRRAGNGALARALVARAEMPQPIVPTKPPPSKGPYAWKKAAYTYRYKQITKAGGDLQVFAPGEAEPVGRATFAIEDMPLVPRPAKDERYTTEHIVGSKQGKVAHLSGIYNNTLIRNGPADIYSGFGEELLKMVEQDCKGLGAWLIYLEASPSQVRLDPNTNDKATRDPATFYAKFGYGPDLAQQAHNSAYLRAQAAQLQLDEKVTLQYVTQMLESIRAATWTKVLA